MTSVIDELRFNYVEFTSGRKVWSKTTGNMFYANKTAEIAYDEENTPAKVETLSITDVVNRISSLNITEKDKRSCIQMFDTKGQFALKDYFDLTFWNGCILCDFDLYHSKTLQERIKDDVKREAVVKNIIITLSSALMDNCNYLYSEVSNSGLGMHVLFYYDVEKNEDNFYKCAEYTKNVILTMVTKMDIHLRDVIIESFDPVYRRPYQRMYATGKNAYINRHCIGEISSDDLEPYENTDIRVSDVDDNGVLKFKVNGYNDETRKFLYHYPTRLVLYTSIASIFQSEEECDNFWRDKICPRLQEYDNYTLKKFQNEAGSTFHYNRVEKKYASAKLLKAWGFDIEYLFNPVEIKLYEPDTIYELSEGQFLSDLDIAFKVDRINHLYVPCAAGKTYNAKMLGKDVESSLDDIEWLLGGVRNKRVCFVSPMKSISKDSFEDTSNWQIIDGDHKEEAKEKFDKSIREILHNSNLNICTTWESFVAYDMNKIEFDYVIVDEAHTFYMYDYRVRSISEFMTAFRGAKGIKILMTGTPSAEVKEFDCYKIQVTKKNRKTATDMIIYNESFKGYYINDIKQWTKDKDHYAIIFQDSTNYISEQMFANNGLTVDIFNSNYKDNVQQILSDHNVKSQITAFSVYGQAGINLYIDTDKKVRIYILNYSGLGIIQYSNRVRNRETIDKVIVGYKKANVDNAVKGLNYKIDYDEGEQKVAMINSTRRTFDVFEPKTKSFIYVNFGLSYDCLDRMGDKFELNHERYKVWKMIKNVAEYEKQIQVIYNRLVQNDFDVNVVYLQNDAKTDAETKLRSNVFAGAMARFDYDMVKPKKEGGFWLNPTDNFLKLCTGTLVDDIEFCINEFYYMCQGDFERTKKMFSGIISKTIEETGSIKKSNITRLALVLKLRKNWNQYYNGAFVYTMLRPDVDIESLTTLYVRSIYNENIDWKAACDEVYNDIKEIHSAVNMYSDMFTDLEVPENINVANDEITTMIHTYVVKSHTRGKRKDDKANSRMTQWRRKNVSN